MAIIRIARQGMRRQDKGRAQARHDTDLDPKLIAFVCLALADTLDLRRMQAVELVSALGLLRRNRSIQTPIDPG